MICPSCKNSDFGIHENHGAKFNICKKCGYVIQTQQSEEYDRLCEEQERIREQANAKPIVTCPYCQSTNTKKITTMSKAGSVALFGIFAMGKVSKQWHCNNCGSDF